MEWIGAFFAGALGAICGGAIYSLFVVSGQDSRLEEAYRAGVKDGIAKAEARRLVGMGMRREEDTANA